MSVVTKSDKLAEIYELTAKPSALDVSISGKTSGKTSGRTYSTTQAQSVDLEGFIKAFRGLTLSEFREMCSSDEQQSPIFPKIAKVLTSHGALVPTVRKSVSERSEVVLRGLAQYSIAESPASLCRRLEKIEPFLAGRIKVPVNAKMRANDTYVKICGQIYFIMLQLTSLADSVATDTEKDEWMRKCTELRDEAARHVDLIKKTYGTFDVLMKGGTWWIQFGPLRISAHNIHNTVKGNF